jgi:hypothetical protein
MMPVFLVISIVVMALFAAVLAGGAWILKLIFGQNNEGVAALVLVMATVIGAIGSEMYRKLTAKVVPPNIH